MKKKKLSFVYLIGIIVISDDIILGQMLPWFNHTVDYICIKIGENEKHIYSKGKKTRP